MTELYKYISSDEELKSLIDNDIFLIEKPEKQIVNGKEKTINEYIIYKYKEIGTTSGRYITQYQVEFDVIGKDINKLITIKNRLIELIDDPRNEKIIKDENNTILSSRLANGGGMVKNSQTGNYSVVVYFVVTKK